MEGNIPEVVQMLLNESRRWHSMAARLTAERGKHRTYMFGQAAGLAMAAGLVRENYGDS